MKRPLYKEKKVFRKRKQRINSERKLNKQERGKF